MNYTDEISEMTLLCQMIMDKSIIPDVQTKVVKECFTQELTRKGYEICIEKQSILDAKVFVKEMKDFNAGSVQDIISATYSSDNWNYYADKIIDLFIKRSVHRICLEHKDPSEEKTGFEELAELNSKVTKIGDQGTGSGIHDTKKALNLLYQSIEKAYNNKGMGNYTNIDELDKLTGGIQNELIVIGARPSIGKAQPLSAKIKTVTGWKLMGEIKVGDKIASIDGELSEVIGVFPQGEKDIYEITFSDGRKTRVTKEHLWHINNIKWGNEKRIIQTDQIIQCLKAKRHYRRLSIPLVSGNFGHNENLIVDPWFLGFYLGDGWCKGSSVMFSNNDQENINRVNNLFKKDNIIANVYGYDYRIKNKQRGKFPTEIFTALKSLGLNKVNSFTKFIPEIYKTANIEARKSLLSGLISTGGNVEKSGTVSYSSVNEKLIDDIVEISQSLGCIVTKRTRQTYFTYKGEKKAGSISYRIHILMNNELKKEILFLRKHRERINHKRTTKNLLTVKSVELIGKEKAQCIMVSHPSSLYITDEYIVTHNTALGLQIAAEQSRNYPVAIFSMEMATESLMRRRVSSLTGIPSDIIRNGMLTNANLLSIQNAMGEIYEKENLKIIDNERRIDKLEAIARKLVRSDGVKLLLFDHFSLTEHENKKLNRNDQFADLANRYQKLRKELKVPIILLCQLRRDAENKEPILADLRETGNMEQNADTVIFIHREREYDPTIREIETKLIVAKQRDGPIGIANTLFVPKRQMFINATSPRGNKEKI